MKNMSENYKDTLIAILLIGIVAMTIIYANFTHYLNVRAQGDGASYKWDIHFENLVNKFSNEIRELQDGETTLDIIHYVIDMDNINEY